MKKQDIQNLVQRIKSDLDDLSEAVAETEALSPSTYRIGMRFRDMHSIYNDRQQRPEYVLGGIDNQAILICLDDGYAYTHEMIDVQDRNKITPEEFSDIASGDEKDFELIYTPSDD